MRSTVAPIGFEDEPVSRHGKTSWLVGAGSAFIIIQAEWAGSGLTVKLTRAAGWQWAVIGH
jgi:hypothetical protein